jgi:hypothetical protein
MKLRLSLLLFLACTLVAGKAMAQTCTTTPIRFPRTFNSNMPFCVASEGGGTQTGRLRWNDNNSHALELFDTDDGGRFLWCAGGGSNQNNCTRGNSLCLQSDGNMVIYQDTNCGGNALWASNTSGGIECALFNNCTNEDGEELFVQDNLVINGGSFGETAVIYNDTDPGSDTGRQLIWHSASSDPN